LGEERQKGEKSNKSERMVGGGIYRTTHTHTYTHTHTHTHTWEDDNEKQEDDRKEDTERIKNKWRNEKQRMLNVVS
jgi:hypothetical protein